MILRFLRYEYEENRSYAPASGGAVTGQIFFAQTVGILYSIDDKKICIHHDAHLIDAH